MYRRITFITLLLLSAAASAGIGFRQSTIYLPATRPLDVAVWYPTLDKRPSETVGDNIVFRGVNVQRDATPAPGAHPVLLLSHGFGGNWRNLNWLAYAMAEQGYIVAAVDHPGTTTRNKSPHPGAGALATPERRHSGTGCAYRQPGKNRETR